MVQQSQLTKARNLYCYKFIVILGKGKGQSDFLDWPLFMPATTYAPTHTLARAVPGLNFRVRDGNGWIPRGKITDKS